LASTEWLDGFQANDQICKYLDNARKRINLKKPAMLVYDSFKGHLDDLVKAKFHKSGVDLAVIPSGLTSICQPLDVAINKPFMDYLRKEWLIWMSKGSAGKTPKGNICYARISEICTWIKCSWERIS
ncbi:6780_t:CDS:1, partial [Gigaspora margarita]